MKLQLCLFSLILVLAACNTKTEQKSSVDQSLKKFYFPLSELSADGLVYEFVDDSLGVAVDYWLYKTVKDNAGDLFLIATGYDALFEQRYFSREWVVADGTILKDYQFMQTDSATSRSIVTPAKIEENIIFPFNPTKDSTKAYRFRMKFSLPPDTAMQYDLVRDRKFDKFLDYDFEGKKINAVQFSSTEYVTAIDRTNGGHWDINSEMIEIYAEGIGLVYKEKKGKGANFKQRLKRRISPDEFSKLKSNNN